jgi:hypothetical protein
MVVDKLELLDDDCKSAEFDEKNCYEELDSVQKMMEVIEKRCYDRKTYRIIANILSFTIMYLITSYGIIPLVRLLLISNKSSDVLGKAITELIDPKLNIDQILTDNLLMTAWDFNHRAPRVFTKWSYKNVHTKKQEYRMSLNEMTHASANTQYYFYPLEIPDRYE